MTFIIWTVITPKWENQSEITLIIIMFVNENLSMKPLSFCSSRNIFLQVLSGPEVILAKGKTTHLIYDNLNDVNIYNII